MYARKSATLALLCLAGLWAVCLGGCSKHGRRQPSSLSTPNGSVIGNWLVDGTSIQVVEDTGVPHDLREGDTFRIGPNGLEVLLGSSMLPGGVYDTFLKTLGGKYTLLVNTAVGGEFQTSLVVDRSAAHGEPEGTLELRIDVRGVLNGTDLEVEYLGRMLLSGDEQERDQLTFTLKPGPQVPPDLTGTFDLTDIRVVADIGAPHPYKPGDPTTCSGSKVVQLLGTDFNPDAVLGTSVGDYVMVQSFSNAFGGHAEALFMALGRENTPAAGQRHYIVFDGVRVGDGLVGQLFHLTDEPEDENIDVLELAMTLRSARQAVLLRDDPKTLHTGRKLVNFIITGRS